MNQGKSIRERSGAEVSYLLKPDITNHQILQDDRIINTKKSSNHDEQLLKGIHGIFPPQYQIALQNSNDKLNTIIMNHKLHYLKNISVINVFDGSSNPAPIDQKSFQQYHISGRQIGGHMPRIENKVPRIHNNDHMTKADMNLTIPNTVKFKASSSS